VRATIELAIDPCFYVIPAKPKMAPHPKSPRTFVSISPGVEGGDRDVEIVGELLRA
jgi:hypothetical protein